MPEYRAPFPSSRGVTIFQISWKAKLLAASLGEVPAIDWVFGAAKPDIALDVRSRVRIRNGAPVVRAPWPSGKAYFLWPDGTMDEIASV